MILWLKILNKNIDDNTGTLREFPFDENCLYTSNYNETLDSFKGRISHTSEIDIEPYDECEVNFKELDGTIRKTLYFCVDTYTLTQDTMGIDNEKFSYDIELFSQTKLLEGIICPNLSITPYKLETNKPRKSIYWYLDKYLKLYGRKIRTKRQEQAVRTTQTTPNGQIQYAIFDIPFSDEYFSPKVEGISITTNNSSVVVSRYIAIPRDTNCRFTIEYTNTTYSGYVNFNINFVVKGFTDKWHFSSEVYGLFNGVDAPEMQWNVPTLREVFNDLFMIKDCIPVLKNNEIGLIDLTQKKNPITDYNYLTRSQSADNYVSEIKMNLQNVMQTQINGVKNSVFTTEYLTFTSKDYAISSNNIILKTKFPILNIKKMYICSWMGGNADTTIDGKMRYKGRLKKIDMTNFIKEYREYQTLPILYNIADIPPSLPILQYYKYANFCVFYNRGSNVIDGWTNLVKTILWATDNTQELLKTISKGVNDGLGGNEVISWDAEPNSYLTMFFEIEYETMTDQVFTASKNGAKNKRTIVDNQTNSWVDAYSQGFLEYMKANRLGNQITMYNQRTSNVWNTTNFGLIDIGDFKDDNVVYQVQYQIFQDHIECNAYATKNYILRNYWVGVNSKIRTWVNAQDEALIRHELEKYYCNIDFEEHDEYEKYEENISMLCAKSVKNQATNDKQINYASMKTFLTEDGSMTTPTSQGDCYLMECVSRIMGNSIVFTFGFDDNSLVGSCNEMLEESDISPIYFEDSTFREPYIKSSATSIKTLLDGTSGLKTQPKKYTDDYCEFIEVSVSLFENCEDTPTNTEYLTGEEQQNFYVNMYKRPVLEESLRNNIWYGMYKNYYKDNKEIFKLSIQLEYYSENNDIYVDNKLVSNNYLVRESETRNTKLYVGNNTSYQSGVLPNNVREITFFEMYLNETSNETTKVEIRDRNDSLFYYQNNRLYLVDADGNVILAFKYNQSQIKQGDGYKYIEIYFNVVRDRDLSVYDENNNIIEEI